jgi:poly(3-hydroxybutyrate) depolymerase
MKLMFSQATAGRLVRGFSVPRLMAPALLLMLTVFVWDQASAQETVELADGSELQVFLLRPSETTTEPSPLLILMGGGTGNLGISRDTSMWLGSGFARRGWMVAVPVSPNNRAFRGGGNNVLIPDLIRVLQQRDYIAGGKVLLAGISNGGLSALEIARRNPEDYLGVVAVPAISRSVVDNEPLAGFPVYLRIGGADQLGWADRFADTVDVMTRAGVDLDAAILDGAPHMFRMDWDSLEPWLKNIWPE